jgi:hypothetical protein
MQVRAKNKGYIGLELINEGEIFDMDEKDLYKRDKHGEIIKGKDGKPVLPMWVEVWDGAPKDPKVYASPEAPRVLKKGRGKGMADQEVI